MLEGIVSSIFLTAFIIFSFISMVLPSEDFEIAIVVAGFPLLNPKLSESSSVNTTLAISFNLSVSPLE